MRKGQQDKTARRVETQSKTYLIETSSTAEVWANAK